MVTDMATHTMVMDITALIITTITTAYHTIEEDETQIITELKIEEDQTFQQETHPIAVQKQHAA
jgi:hypothetical protein